MYKAFQRRDAVENDQEYAFCKFQMRAAWALNEACTIDLQLTENDPRSREKRTGLDDHKPSARQESLPNSWLELTGCRSNNA